MEYKKGQKLLVSGRLDAKIVQNLELYFNQIVQENMYDSPNDRIFEFVDKLGSDYYFYPDDIFSIKIID